MEMTFINKAMQHLSDFAIMFNKNTFSLMPSQNLDLWGNISPNQSIETSLPLKIDGLAQLAQPVNSNLC
jgi:AP-2 complex subunit beta-1